MQLGIPVNRPRQCRDEICACQSNLVSLVSSAGTVQEDRDEIIVKRAELSKYARDRTARIGIILAPQTAQIP